MRLSIFSANVAYNYNEINKQKTLRRWKQILEQFFLPETITVTERENLFLLCFEQKENKSPASSWINYVIAMATNATTPHESCKIPINHKTVPLFQSVGDHNLEPVYFVELKIYKRKLAWNWRKLR